MVPGRKSSMPGGRLDRVGASCHRLLSQSVGQRENREISISDGGKKPTMFAYLAVLDDALKLLQDSRRNVHLRMRNLDIKIFAPVFG